MMITRVIVNVNGFLKHVQPFHRSPRTVRRMLLDRARKAHLS